MNTIIDVRAIYRDELEVAKDECWFDPVKVAVAWTTQKVVRLIAYRKHCKMAQDNPGW